MLKFINLAASFLANLTNYIRTTCARLPASSYRINISCHLLLLFRVVIELNIIIHTIFYKGGILIHLNRFWDFTVRFQISGLISIVFQDHICFFATMPVCGSVLRFAKLSDNAFPPLKGSAYAAGWDLRSAYDYILPARGRLIAQTDIQIAVPDGCYGRIAPRSGLAAKYGIDTGAGVIDADYRGNVGVVLFNHNDSDFIIKKGDRIAQLICEKIDMADLLEEKKLDDTVRGSNGFGSTGGVSHGTDGNGV